MKEINWSQLINNVWERENALGKRAIEGKGGYRNGLYFPYVTPNGNTDIGPGFDLEAQTPEFRERAKRGFTRAELDSIVQDRMKKELPFFRQRITKEGGDPHKIPDKVYEGLLDMQWQLNNQLYTGYDNLWKAVAKRDYDGMQRESKTYYRTPNGKKVLDEGRWKFRKNTYFRDSNPSEKNSTLFQFSAPNINIVEVPDATRVIPHPTTQFQTVVTVSDREHPAMLRKVSPGEDKASRLRQNAESTVHIKKMLDAVSIQNNPAPKYPFPLQFKEGGATNRRSSLSVANNRFAGGGYVYDILPKMLKEAGLNVKVTSGYRKPGQAGKAGNKSWHTHHGAVDIIPQGKTTFEDIENALYNNPTISRYMMDNGFGLLDESGRTTESKATMKKTGATGAHFHIGKDTAARKAYTDKMSSLWDSRMKQLHQTVAAPEEQIAFMPANPEVFFSSPAPFEATAFETPPVKPTVETTLQRQDKEVERQDRLRGLSLLNWVLNGAPFPLSV